MNEKLEVPLEAAARLLRQAKRIVCLTGAGVSADHRVLALRMGVDAQGHTMIVAQDTTGLFYLSDRTGPWRTVRLPVGPLDAWNPDWTAVFSRDGVFTLVHLDSPTPETIARRTSEFDPASCSDNNKK